MKRRRNHFGDSRFANPSKARKIHSNSDVSTARVRDVNGENDVNTGKSANVSPFGFHKFGKGDIVMRKFGKMNNIRNSDEMKLPSVDSLLTPSSNSRNKYLRTLTEHLPEGYKEDSPIQTTIHEHYSERSNPSMRIHSSRCNQRNVKNRRNHAMIVKKPPPPTKTRNPNQSSPVYNLHAVSSLSKVILSILEKKGRFLSVENIFRILMSRRSANNKEDMNFVSTIQNSLILLLRSQLVISTRLLQIGNPGHTVTLYIAKKCIQRNENTLPPPPLPQHMNLQPPPPLTRRQPIFLPPPPSRPHPDDVIASFVKKHTAPKRLISTSSVSKPQPRRKQGTCMPRNRIARRTRQKEPSLPPPPIAPRKKSNNININTTATPKIRGRDKQKKNQKLKRVEVPSGRAAKAFIIELLNSLDKGHVMTIEQIVLRYSDVQTWRRWASFDVERWIWKDKARTKERFLSEARKLRFEGKAPRKYGHRVVDGEFRFWRN